MGFVLTATDRQFFPGGDSATMRACTQLPHYRHTPRNNPMAKKKVVIMLLNANPDIPATLGSPFYQATAAAAMDLEVEIYFASRAAALLRKGVAEQLYPGERREKSIYSFMQDAHAAGVRFYACGAALDENGIDDDSAIPELDEVRGGSAFIDAATQDHVLTLTY